LAVIDKPDNILEAASVGGLDVSLPIRGRFFDQGNRGSFFSNRDHIGFEMLVSLSVIPSQPGLSDGAD
jgi:hypothetical protein